MDKRTRDFLKLWGPQEMPTATVSNGVIRPGTYPAFAMLGWVESGPGGWPSIGLLLALRRSEVSRQAGTLTMGLPLCPKTERHVCGLLQDLGWDGRVWPYKDHGWPEGTADEQPLLQLMKNGKIGATFTFPSDPDKGVPVIPVHVAKIRDTFHTAPFSETLPRYLDELRAYGTDPAPFKSDW